MKGKATIILFAAISTLAYGQSAFMQTLETGYRSGMYQQDSLMFVDPVGDAFLLRKLDTIPVKLTSYLFHHSLPQAENGRKQDYKTGRTVPFDSERLLNRCAEIMRSNFPDIFPTMSEEHKWSPEARSYLPYGYWHRLGRKLSGKQLDFPSPTLLRSKLFLCLACGYTSRFCFTGCENALREYIMSRPDRSIQLDELFEQSYLLNKGDVYLAFLTCENLLAGMPHKPDRNSDTMHRKLAYIRHDSEELGDNYGAWYHFFGIALYGMLRPDFVSVFVADTESLGSFFMEGADPQEDLINHYGAKFGAQFRKMLEEGSWWLRNGSTDYMIPNPLTIQQSNIL